MLRINQEGHKMLWPMFS